MLEPITRSLPAAAARRRIVAFIASAIVATTAAGMVAAPALAHGGDGLRAAANTHRVEHHLVPVIGTNLLDDIATRRAIQMVNRDRLEHDMDYVSKRLNSAGVCWRSFGEIIAWEAGYRDYSYDRTMDAWWDSKPHHDIIMTADFNAAGGAWSRGDDGDHYSVMVFARLCGASTNDDSVPRLSPDRQYDPDRPMLFRTGTYTGYKLSATGDVLRRKTVTFSEGATPMSAGRARANGKAWLKVSSGKLDGYWVHETPSSFVRGMTQYRAYASDRAVSLESGKYRGARFDSLGRVTDTRARSFNRKREAQVAARAIINGRVYLKFSSGYLGGFWVRDTSKIDFK
jgi:hypothetical protein